MNKTLRVSINNLVYVYNLGSDFIKVYHTKKHSEVKPTTISLKSITGLATLKKMVRILRERGRLDNNINTNVLLQ